MLWFFRMTICAVALLGVQGAARHAVAADDARSAVKAALKRQDEWLARPENAGPKADRWRQYLLVDRLRQQLAAPSPDPDVLARVYARYTSGVPGLDHPRAGAVRRALSAWLGSLPLTPLDELARSVGEGEGLFVPTTPEEVDAARQKLAAALTRLDAYLTPGGANGENWKKFLHFDELQALAAPGAQPDLRGVPDLILLFQSGYEGLEMRVFAEVGDALEQFYDVAQVQRVGDQHAAFERDRKVFRERLDNYLQHPGGEAYDDLAEAVDYFQRRRYAAGVLPRVRRHFNQPNLIVSISETMVGEAMNERVDEPTQIVDSILGTSIRGTGQTRGVVHIDLAPQSDYARLLAVFTGRVDSRTVGVNGPAIIHTAGVTTFQAQQAILLDAMGLSTHSATAAANVCTQTLCIGSSRRLGGRIVRRVASKRVAQSKGQAEYIGARHAEARLVRQMGERVVGRMADANKTYRERFRAGLQRRNAFPAALDFSTTNQALVVEWMQRGPGQLAAPTPPPALRGDADISARLHESMLNHLTDSALAGVKLDDRELERLLKEVYGEVPRQFQREPDDKPWSITFARRRPVTARFADDTLSITIRGSRYTSGESAYEAMNVSTTYKVERSGKAMALVRQGEIEIFPPNFKQGQTLTPKQVALRTLLAKRFNKIFEPRYDLARLELTGALADSGQLEVREFAATDGWIATSWILKPPPPTSLAADADRPVAPLPR